MSTPHVGWFKFGHENRLDWKRPELGQVFGWNRTELLTESVEDLEHSFHVTLEATGGGGGGVASRMSPSHPLVPYRIEPGMTRLFFLFCSGLTKGGGWLWWHHRGGEREGLHAQPRRVPQRHLLLPQVGAIT